MKYEIKKNELDNFFEVIDELEKLLTERICDLHEIKGMMQARHAYILYRKLLWNAKHSIIDSVKEIKSKTK